MYCGPVCLDRKTRLKMEFLDCPRSPMHCGNEGRLLLVGP
jgi:hypothetical protein